MVTKVLWIGDAGAHTGFARVTHSIGDRLVNEYGHDIHVLAINFRGDYWPSPLKMYRPNMIVDQDVYGFSRIVELLGKVEPEVVVLLNDPAIVISELFDNAYDTNKYLLQYRPIIAYMPIDGHNWPPNWFEILPKVCLPVVMTKYGQSAVPGSRLVYHGIDPDEFWPVSEERPVVTSTGIVCKTKRECKAAFSYPLDSFLVLRIDKNSGRKDFAATWKALIPVMRKHDDIICHLHAASSGPESGVNLPNLFSRDPDTAVRFYLPGLHNSYFGWEQPDLNCLYNAADLFVTTSRGEGFGLTIAESLACGVPVIAQNVSAIPEVVGPGGVLLEPEREITVPSGQDLWLPDIGAFSEAIERLYLDGDARRKLGAAGREHVVSSFSWDVAAARFDEYIRELAGGTDTLEVSDAVRSEFGPSSSSAV